MKKDTSGKYKPIEIWMAVLETEGFFWHRYKVLEMAGGDGVHRCEGT